MKAYMNKQGRVSIDTDSGLCNDDCEWLLKLSTEPKLPLVSECYTCALFSEALNIDLRSGRVKASEACRSTIRQIEGERKCDLQQL